MNNIKRLRASLWFAFALFCCIASSASAQVATSACGVRCTYFVARYCDHDPGTLARTAQLINVSSDGSSTLLGIRNGLSTLGIKSEGRRCTVAQLRDVQLGVLAIKTDEGPHFVVYVGRLCTKGTVTLVDSPSTVSLSESEFAEKWDGIILRVADSSIKNTESNVRVTSLVQSSTQPAPGPPAASPSKSANGYWVSPQPVAELHQVILPMREPLKLAYLVRNVSRQPLRIGRLTTSCGCTSAEADKKIISAGDQATVNVIINPANAAQGWQNYRVAVSSLDEGVPPLVLEARVEFRQLLSVRPQRLYFGNIIRMRDGASATVDIVEDAELGAIKVLGIRTSTSWITATMVRDGRVIVAVSSAVPAGPFHEYVTIDTNRGAVNIPILGEGVGSFRILPNPVLLMSKSLDTDVEIVRSEGCELDLKALVLQYDSAQLDARLLPETSEDRCRIHLRLNGAAGGLSTYNVNVHDQSNSESIDLHIVHGIDP